MSPNELALLRLADLSGQVDKWSASRKLGISTDYAAYLCQSVSQRGYLARAPSGKYHTTEKGVEAVLAELYRLRGALHGRAESFRWQRDRVGEQIARLEGGKTWK